MSFKRPRFLLAILVPTIACSATVAQPVQPYRAAPLFEGKSLPEPPHQHDPWSPPKSSLPENCVSSIEAVIKYGFANPRGCEYCEVELPCGYVGTNNDFVFKTHAWVIPSGNANGAQQFAVAWNGLIYPAVAAGDRADLKADIAALVKQSVANYRSSAPMESDLLWHQSVNDLKVCMLLFLGESEAAEQLWKVLQKVVAQPDADPYLRFAHEFTWANYDRAVTAHMRGDDVVSLYSAQAAQRIRDNVEKDAAARGLKRPSQSQGKPALYLDFLHNIDLLVADEHRRAKTKKPERVLDLGINKFSDQKQRIAALIRDLEEVGAKQWSQPGGVDLADDGIVQALIKEGEAAIGPLIQCFESDARLTRSVGFGRSFHTGRYLLGADDAAYRAICEILKVRTFGPLTEHPYHSDSDSAKRAQVAEEIRAYWNKVRGIAELDRWYQTLADDKAIAQQWLETAKKVTGPIPRQPGATVPPRMVTALGPPRPLAGERLRDKKNPTVTDLFRKRADDVAAQNHGTSHRVYSQEYACEITLALAKWEPQAAIPEIRKRIEQCKVLFTHEFHANHAKLLAPWFSRLCAAGMDAGDEFAADEYAKWLRSLSPDKLEFGETTGVFYALCRSPDNPKLSEAARLLFLTESPYQPLHAKVRGHEFAEYVGWPLIGVSEFRQMVKQELRNAGPSGATLKLSAEDDSYKIEFAGTSFGQAITNSQDPAATNNFEHPLRVCDLYAWCCTKLEGAPIFEPYWPQDRRDEAIAELIAVLEKFGECYRLLPNIPADRIRHPFNEPEFHLPKLDHPATADDVQQARAIFSLEDDKSDVRLVELPMFPQMARWKTLERFPVRYRGHKDAPAEYDRAGYIWQAEEILTDGKWQRYYGFVGNHIIAKVPADEIEYLQKYGDDRHLRW